MTSKLKLSSNNRGRAWRALNSTESDAASWKSPRVKEMPQKFNSDEETDLSNVKVDISNRIGTGNSTHQANADADEKVKRQQRAREIKDLISQQCMMSCSSTVARWERETANSPAALSDFEQRTDTSLVGGARLLLDWRAKLIKRQLERDEGNKELHG
jgi:hypothetical protein